MNHQKIFPDDPRLTAYALGELSGAERAEVEVALAGDPAARAAVDEIRALAAQLEGALAEEPLVVPLSAAAPARKEIRATARETDHYSRKVTRFPYVWIGTLAAACFAVVVTLRDDKPAPLSLAKTEPEKFSTEHGPASSQPTLPQAEGQTKMAGDNGNSATVAQTQGSSPSVLLVKDADEFAAIPAPEIPADKSKDAWSGQQLPVSETLAAIAPVAPPKAEPLAGAPVAPSIPAQVPYAESHGTGVATTDAVIAQPAPSPTKSTYANTGDDEVILLSAFEVKEDRAGGYIGAGGSPIRGSRVARSQTGGLTSVDNRRAFYGSKDLLTFSAPRTNFRAKSTTPFSSAESYVFMPESDFFRVRSSPLSTFSIDVDTASYANVRRFLDQGQRPPRDAVRVEEMVNYFNYRYAPPAKEAAEPFAASMEIAAAPWNPAHRLVRIGLKGREVTTEDRPAANLVFLLDVSGSMDAENKLPLVKESLRLLVEKLSPDDRVAIVTYAGNSGLALPSTSAGKKNEILSALGDLRPSGSTNGAMGIQLAYDIAKANFITGGANRVILCTDGDFNVGVTGEGDLTRLIEEKAKSGVFLTVLGFGMGNLKDGTLERLADRGNGHYGYVDSRAEAHKLLVEQAGGTLVTIAKDVKLQVEFNPAVAQAYRLIGYENRVLKKEDFNDDKVDAGEIGAGHTVTALYEIVPVGAPAPKASPEVDPLKYQTTKPDAVAASDADEIKPLKPRINPEELLTLKIRFKEPTVDISRKMEIPAVDVGAGFDAASKDFKFAAAVASLGMMLRESAHLGTTDYDRVISWAEAGKGDDADGRRGEFIELAKKARALSAE
jgi:secreted protein with Ig-like and vWFA domain